MTSNEKLEKVAAEIHAIRNPMWPKRWGWTEVPEATKASCRKDAARIMRVLGIQDD